jgi:hypothetical protein
MVSAGLAAVLASYTSGLTFPRRCRANPPGTVRSLDEELR